MNEAKLEKDYTARSDNGIKWENMEQMRNYYEFPVSSVVLRVTNASFKTVRSPLPIQVWKIDMEPPNKPWSIDLINVCEEFGIEPRKKRQYRCK